MVGEVTVKVHTSEFIKGLGSAGNELKKLIYQRMIVTTEFLKAEAVKEAPSDTGNLRARMVKRTLNERGRIRGYVGNTAEYAPYVHQGTGVYAQGGAGRKTPWLVETVYKGKPTKFLTSGQKPNPFLKRAQEKNMDKIKSLLGVK